MRSSNRLMNNKHDEDEVTRLTASLSQVMRSLRSFSFLRPANAIFVPGMYYRERTPTRQRGRWGSDVSSETHLFRVLKVVKQSLLVPSNALVHVGSGVGEALSLASLTAKNAAVDEDVSAPSWPL